MAGGRRPAHSTDGVCSDDRLRQVWGRWALRHGTVGGVVGFARFTVTADDTTGALETAAACADLGLRATVSGAGAGVASGAVGSTDGSTDGVRADVTVIDLRSRHLEPLHARARLAAFVRRRAALDVHKIDSTLRGNWAAEVGALVDAGRRVVMVPAFPAAGRTCVGGVVRVDGEPVHLGAFGHDPRSPVTTSRPADSLAGAVEAADAGATAAALDAGATIVVADAADDRALEAHVRAVHDRDDRDEVVLVGPAAVATALARRRLGASALTTRGASHIVTRSSPSAVPPGRVLVVSASRHPSALEQLVRVRGRGIPVVQPPPEARPADADAVLAALADEARRQLAADDGIGTLVVVGGDTAAAVLGDTTIDVVGTVGVGVAAGVVHLMGRRLRLITKPGGFGSADTLVDVLDALDDRWPT